MRVLVIEIVLQHVDERQFQQRRVVQGAMEGRRGVGAIAAETDGHLLAAPGAECEGRAGGKNGSRTDHAVSTDVAAGLVREVHLARVSAVETGRPEIIFGGHLLHIDAFRDGMAGRTMRAEDDVELLERPFVVQRRANAGGDRFLARHRDG